MVFQETVLTYDFAGTEGRKEEESLSFKATISPLPLVHLYHLFHVLRTWRN